MGPTRDLDVIATYVAGQIKKLAEAYFAIPLGKQVVITEIGDTKKDVLARLEAARAALQSAAEQTHKEDNED